MIRASVYGRLGGDPVERQTRNNSSMATASLAVNVARYGQDEDKVWLSLAAFGKTADDLLRHSKGDLLAVMGQMTKRRFTDHEGQERESWSVTCDAIVSARTVRPGGKRKRGAAARRGGVGGQPATNPELNDSLPI